MDDQKNMIIAAVLSFMVIMLWTFYFAPPPPEPTYETVEVSQDGAPAPQGQTGGAAQTGSTPESGDSEQGGGEAANITIDTPSLIGSFSLKGGRIDNLSLKNYRDNLDEGSDIVHQLNPVGDVHPYFAAYGWLPGEGQGTQTPNPNTLWSVESGSALGPGQPVTLKWDNGAGLIFRRTLSVDDKYMFTVTQSVENKTSAQIQLSPYGYVARRGFPETINFFILHEGAVGVFDDELKELDYDDMADLPPVGRSNSEQIPVQQNGFIGFTDKYWMTAIAPGPGAPFTAVFKHTQRATGPEYRTEALMPLYDIAPGSTTEVTTYLFSGAKEYEAITGYEETLGIAKFIDSIDWGWFFFLTKPIFQLLLWVKGFVGNMGWSIIVLTLIIKAALFPLAYRSYVSMSKMKKLQPEMEKIKERVGDDKQAMQKEMMALYKKEGANPAAGCLPILLQIPIFFSL
ncbi:MAG: membrane protein insertase YidC, partial [Pseudomonadota bacterium]